MKKHKICHMTSAHSEFDIRIFIKECISLVNNNYEVHYIVPGVMDTVVNEINIHGVKKEKKNRFIRMTQTTNLIYQKALHIDAEIYHFHDSELIPVALKLKKKGKKVIYDIHEDLPRAIMSKKWIKTPLRKIISVFFENYEDWASQKFDYLFTATPFITERFKKINPNTVNINNYPLLNELQNLESKKITSKYVSYVGGLGPIRGSNQLLEAVNLINGSLHIAGPISPDNEKEKFLTHEKVKYLGFINREEVKDLLSSSFAGIVTFLPEPNHINAQPNKMFEYMSASIPVICSDFPLWRSIIEKHNCGICVDPNNPQAISNAINYIFNNPEIAEDMGRCGRIAIEKEYNWEQESKKLLDAYNKITN